MPMKTSGWLSRHRFAVGTATSAAAVALIAVGVPAAALATHPASHARPARSGRATRRRAASTRRSPTARYSTPSCRSPWTPTRRVRRRGQPTSGSITIGNITTPVVRPVNVQFGFWTPPNATNGGQPWRARRRRILPPTAGLSAHAVHQAGPDPGEPDHGAGLCHYHRPGRQGLCTKAENFGGKYLDVYALAQSAGAITNFALTTWTQRVKFQLINPLLGNNCYIGSVNNPVVLNPQLTVPPGHELPTTRTRSSTRTPRSSVHARLSPATPPSPRPASPAAARVAWPTSRLTRRSTPGRPARGVRGQQPHAQRQLLCRCLDPAAAADHAKILQSAFKDSSRTPARPPGSRPPDLRRQPAQAAAGVSDSSN